MPRTREELEIEARSLPPEDRARLAEALIASLDENSEIERQWAEESERRAAELDEGTAQAIPADQVFAELDELLSE